MSRPRECAHTERYQDGRCKVCTRSRHKKYIADTRRRAKTAKAQGRRTPLLTIDELLDRPPPCDLL